MTAISRRVLLGTGLALAAGGPALARRQTWVDQEVRQFLAFTGAPGLQLSLLRRGVPLIEGTWGAADRWGSPLRADHRLRVASLSKPITAATALRLVDAGRLSLDRTVFGPNSILGDVYGPTSGAVRAIRVRHLLSHSCGGWTNDGADPTMNYPGLTADQLIARTIAAHPLSAAPGSRQLYSNFGYLVLGRIIERVTGSGYEAWVRQDLLARAGVGGMRIGAQGPTSGEPAYFPHNGLNPHAFDLRRSAANGGWTATAGELTRLISRIDGRPNGLLSNASVTAMRTPPQAGWGFGHGWTVNAIGNRWHTGILPGTAAFMCLTADGHAMAALSNFGGPGSGMEAALDQLMFRLKGVTDGWSV